MAKNVTNKSPKTDWKPGDECYLYEPWSDSVTSARIGRVSPGGRTVGLVGPTVGDRPDVPLHAVFPTFDGAMGALCEANDALEKAYESRIASVQDLLQFALDERVGRAEEYTDWEARAAFVARARALLGIELRN